VTPKTMTDIDMEDAESILANVEPRRGCAFIEMEPVFDETMQGIVIPKKYQHQKKAVGKIRAISMDDSTRRFYGGDMRDVFPGTRVLMIGGQTRPLSGNLVMAPLVTKDWNGKPEPTILAILADGANVAKAAGGERCQHCGPAKQGSDNAMLLFDGVCPRCSLDRNGERSDPTPKTTDDEARMFAAQYGLH